MLLMVGAGVDTVWLRRVVSERCCCSYPTSGVKNRKNSFRILSARFILVKGEGKIRDARGSEIQLIDAGVIVCIVSIIKIKHLIAQKRYKM